MSATGPSPQIQKARVNAPGAIAALVFGILGLTILPLIGPILALVFGYQSRSAARSDPSYDDGLGLVGRVLGWIGLVLVVLFIVFFFTIFAVFIPNLPR